MNWQKEAISDLNCYLARKNSILVMQEKIKELRAKEERLKSSGNTTPVQGGSSKSEDMIINCIIECDHLKENIIALPCGFYFGRADIGKIGGRDWGIYDKGSEIGLWQMNKI